MWKEKVSPDKSHCLCLSHTTCDCSVLPLFVAHSAAAAVLSQTIKKQKHYQNSVYSVEAHSIQGQAKNVNELTLQIKTSQHKFKE